MERSEVKSDSITQKDPGRSIRFKTFSSLNIPAYRLYFGALLGQMAAMNMQMVARSWFMYELTGRAYMLGVVALAGALPMLSLSLFGGVSRFYRCPMGNWGGCRHPVSGLFVLPDFYASNPKFELGGTLIKSVI
jgi:hypothetical protein